MGCLLAKPVYNPDDFVNNEETFNRDDMLTNKSKDLDDVSNKSGHDIPDENSLQIEKEEEEERQMLQEQSRLKLQALALQLGETNRLEESNASNTSEIDTTQVQMVDDSSNYNATVGHPNPAQVSSLTPYNDDTISELESVVTLNSATEGNGVVPNNNKQSNNKSKNYYKNKNKNKNNNSKDKSFNK